MTSYEDIRSKFALHAVKESMQVAKEVSIRQSELDASEYYHQAYGARAGRGQARSGRSGACATLTLMRHARRLFPLLLLLSAGPARAAQPAPAHVVVARLVNWPREQHAPACGRAHWVVLMEYELVRIETGEPIDSRFWVAVSCPEMARGRGPTEVQHFVVGDLHRLALAAKYPSSMPRPFCEIRYVGSALHLIWRSGRKFRSLGVRQGVAARGSYSRGERHRQEAQGQGSAELR